MKFTKLLLPALLSLAVLTAAPLRAQSTIVLGNITFTQTTNAAGQIVLSPIATNTVPTAAPVNTVPGQFLGTLQSYIIDNDPSYTGWSTYYLDAWQAAVFQEVNGVQGASPVGNVLGVEVPVWRPSSNTDLHLESLTDFEAVFGDIGWQGFGAGYDWNLHQIQASFVADIDLALKGPFTARFAPGLELKKASTSLNGISPILRWDVPFQKKIGWGRIFLGVQVPIGPKS